VIKATAVNTRTALDSADPSSAQAQRTSALPNPHAGKHFHVLYDAMPGVVADVNPAARVRPHTPGGGHHVQNHLRRRTVSLCG
jgi:hypothetical protein